MDNNFLQWARENLSKALIPNAVLEPRHSHEGIGAAVAVRVCLYLEKAYNGEIREALAQSFDDYCAVAGTGRPTFGTTAKRRSRSRRPGPCANLPPSLARTIKQL